MRPLRPLDEFETAMLDDEPDVLVEPFPYWGMIIMAFFLGGVTVWVVMWEVLS